MWSRVARVPQVVSGRAQKQPSDGRNANPLLPTAGCGLVTSIDCFAQRNPAFTEVVRNTSGAGTTLRAALQVERGCVGSTEPHAGARWCFGVKRELLSRLATFPIIAPLSSTNLHLDLAALSKDSNCSALAKQKDQPDSPGCHSGPKATLAPIVMTQPHGDWSHLLQVSCSSL